MAIFRDGRGAWDVETSMEVFGRTGWDADRWSNILTLDREHAVGAAHLAGRPLEAYIEVAARCNLRCPMCPITVDPRYAPEAGGPALLTPDRFERLAPLFPSLTRAYLFGLGEPVLNPHLAEYTRRLAAAGVEVWITTNGTLIDDERAEALVLAGVARVSVSIDGATPETYERIRRHGRFSDVLRGLRALGAAKRRHGRPELVLSLIAMASNLGELPHLVEICAEVGGDGVFVEGLYPWNHPAIEDFYRRENLGVADPAWVEECFEAGRNRAESLGVGWWSRAGEQHLRPSEATVPLPDVRSEETNPVKLTLPWACSEPWATVNVSAAGEVRTCCFNNTVFGSLEHQGIEEIWNGNAYQELRREQAAGTVSAGCESCARNGRVKRSQYLSIPGDLGAGPPASHGREIVLELPRDGELVQDPLVIVGRLGRPGCLRRRLSREELPALYIDEVRIATQDSYGMVDGDWFAATVPLGFVSVGSHQISLRQPGRDSGAGERRSVQVGQVGNEDGALVAVSRLAVPVWLQWKEPAPRLRLDGKDSSLGRWLCGRYGTAWLGVAVMDVSGLPPGPHEVELTFRRQSVVRRCLERLEVRYS